MKEIVTNFESVLSPLENDALKVLWPNKSMRVRDIYNKLKGNRRVALSSVAVILDRLHEHSVVTRIAETGRGGVRYVYTPRHDKKSFEKSIVDRTVNKLISQFGPTAVSYFNERFGKR